MKKLATILLALILTLSLGATFIGCSHTHEWGEFQVTKEATCTEKGEKVAKCKGCEETKTEEIPMKDHEFNVPANRILIWRGDVDNIVYHYICANCDTVSDRDESLGNYRSLQQLMNPPDHPNAIKEFYKVIDDYYEDDVAAFSIMLADKRLEIGMAGQPARVCNITETTDPVTGAKSDGDIKGEITVVNGKLIIKGNIKFSGKIVVKSGCTLEIKSGVTVANSGSIVVEKGATLVNQGNVTGTAIDNKN